MKGKLIVLEGTDACGKSTQFSRLCEHLSKKGVKFKQLVFPRYENESSALIRMYLDGKFGNKPDDVNAYAASTFFAVDRYASFKQDWQNYYENGGLILADRYTTSNAIHQASKLTGDDREVFLDWLFDFEYRLLGMPAPDAVFFLDMPIDNVRILLQNREGKTEDIHERDFDYLQNCYNTASLSAEKYAWNRIKCVKNGKIRTIEDISHEIASFMDNII